MFKKFIMWCLFLVLLIITGCSEDRLYKDFKNPPASARPFVRWWWNGNNVTENEILRELDVMKSAGIGGIEINPIAMPKEASKTDTPSLMWGSPEWSQIIKVAADGAKDRGMITDIIIGTGWPFGGRFLQPEEQIKGVILKTVNLTGPSRFTGSLDDFFHTNNKSGHGRNVDPHSPIPPLLFIRLVPENIKSIDQCVDVTDKIDAENRIVVQVPAGNYTLVMGFLESGESFRQVMHGAPGADGPCLDHYNKKAVIKYCDRLADAIEPILGGPLGKSIRALFVDSIELAGSNWTSDILEEFKKRNGYDLIPYFPFVFYEDNFKGYQELSSENPTFNDIIRRVRYDYSKTLVDLFLERFTQTYHDWCHEHGTLSRYQAYGVPWLMGMAEGFMIPDIPESNNWLFSPDAYTHGYNIWNKYTSSGAHLTGKSIASCEAMTNTRGVFQTTLETIKRADDLNFIMGINHSVLHGFNYSPPEAGFPGWVRYGAYFSEQNTWWPYFKKWAAYNARLSAVFQASQPVVDMAILHPTGDIWSNNGLARVPFHLTPWYCHRLWEPISQNGCTADYISEKVIQEAEFNHGEVNYGPMKYKVLVLADVKSLQPETAKAIARYAKAGGKIVFIGSVPDRSLSLVDNKINDDIVKKSMESVLNVQTGNIAKLAPPVTKAELVAWTQNMIKSIRLEPPVRISKPDDQLYQIHHKYENKDLFFFANSDFEKGIEFSAEFTTSAKTPWIWDPGTGERKVLPYGENKHKLDISLEPLESLLLVFEPHKTGKPEKTGKVDRIPLMDMTSPWQCHFQPVQGESFDTIMEKLIDLSQSNDNRLQNFAGNVIYKAEFELDQVESLELDLGEVAGISEVRVNGKLVGENWWGRHRYDLTDAVQKGQNSLEIKVTTLLLNYVKSLKENPTAQRWTKNQEPVPTGLLGPVSLFELK